jgi:hypothetical protein
MQRELVQSIPPGIARLRCARRRAPSTSIQTQQHKLSVLLEGPRCKLRRAPPVISSRRLVSHLAARFCQRTSAGVQRSVCTLSLIQDDSDHMHAYGDPSATVKEMHVKVPERSAKRMPEMQPCL